MYVLALATDYDETIADEGIVSEATQAALQRLKETGRKLILGGVEIPHTLGLLGHSDADALLHAITDAVLGAAALGDIGRHFPDTDGRWKGASSIDLLRRAARVVHERGLSRADAIAVMSSAVRTSGAPASS